MKAIDDALSVPRGINDKDTILSLLVCECRILYRNQDMVTFVEEQFKMFFKETHDEIDNRVAFPEVKQAIEDVKSMVELHDGEEAKR